MWITFSPVFNCLVLSAHNQVFRGGRCLTHLSISYGTQATMNTRMHLNIAHKLSNVSASKPSEACEKYEHVWRHRWSQALDTIHQSIDTSGGYRLTYTCTCTPLNIRKTKPQNPLCWHMAFQGLTPVLWEKGLPTSTRMQNIDGWLLCPDSGGCWSLKTAPFASGLPHPSVRAPSLPSYVSAYTDGLKKTCICTPLMTKAVSCWIRFSFKKKKKKSEKGVGRGANRKSTEQSVFLLDQCLFSWQANAFFSPFDILLMVPLKYI